MKITVVVDNCMPTNNRRPLRAEHGLALLLESEGQKMLLDTGQSDVVVHNLGLLGVRPEELDAIVISHGHYDHTGGLYHVLKMRQKPIPVYAHPAIFKNRVSVSGRERAYIGLPYVREQLTALGADWRLSDRPRQILPQLWLSGQIPRVVDFEVGDTRLMTPTAAGDIPDPLEDDGAMYLVTGKGLVVIAGCAHAGLVNTVEYGLKLTGCDRLAGWVGGTHLGPVGEQQRQRTLAALERFAPDVIAANHCTGFAMMAELARRFGANFIPAFVGTVIEI